MGNRTDRDLAIMIGTKLMAIKQALDDLMDTCFIIYQPKSAVTSLGEDVQFHVVAMNAVAYRWQYKRSDIDWTNVSSQRPGYNTDTVTVTVTETNINNEWRCRLTDADGNYVYTDPVVFITEGG